MAWMGLVESPIRSSLHRFARYVDVEGVVQEALLRMWVLAPQRGRQLVGTNASLRFAIQLARNVAREEGRRVGPRPVPPFPDDEPVPPAPTPDPGLRRVVQDCLAALPPQPLKAIRQRLQFGDQLKDTELARRARMTLNTFLQNVTRARRLLRGCLEKRDPLLRGSLR